MRYALCAMADLTARIALSNYSSEEVVRLLMGRMEKVIAKWRAEHLMDGDLNQIC